MGSMISILTRPSTPSPSEQHVLICGAGVVGLALAQGCREAGIPYTLFERDENPSSRAQGWALTLHWCLDALERTIGPERAAKLDTAVVDSSLKEDEGNFLFLNAATSKPKYRIPPSKRRLRLHRQKLRNILASGLDIQYGKAAESFQDLPDGRVQVTFKDKSTAVGTLLVGADGNNSAIRSQLCAQPALYRLPVNLIGVVRHFTPKQAKAVREIDPLLFQALHPETGNYLWFSIQECIPEPNGETSYKALVIISWLIHDEAKDAIPPTSRERIQLMKERAEGFAEPLRSIVMDIPDEEALTTPLRLGDYVPDIDRKWDNLRGKVTLAGDAAHAMTMYRGEGANHGILDAALLVDSIKTVMTGKVTQEEAVNMYEQEMCTRTKDAVLKSRRAALDAHVWDKVNDESPCIGARIPPATA
ncbi:hypothetical protein BDV59DRAFT_197562 [Aspergillus ambiguus]|uniref:FAD-dependent oxidoreductase n=1 Tax=Aspergillus ambiguus TaxID=176160 RepID=UPI003CCDC328